MKAKAETTTTLTIEFQEDEVQRLYDAIAGIPSEYPNDGRSLLVEFLNVLCDSAGALDAHQRGLTARRPGLEGM